MTSTRGRRGLTISAAVVAAAVAVGTSATGVALAAPDGTQKQKGSPAAGDPHDQLPDLDARRATAAPSAAQRAA
ncbi:hypothetical protein, partial [Knoellia aerolata]|uniref:hypothetical protein n=1 Tax=Knoellia aerolata TaxID=442954 RepID=UPI0012EDC7E7